MHEKERLNRYLARHGVCSRRAADTLIASGRVKVNEKVVRTLGTIVDGLRDIVLVDGERVLEAPDPRVIIFHKPVGVLSTCKHGREKGPIILDYLPNDRRYFPVGRLDKDSSGLLLITDDGDLAHKLAHPRFGSKKVYRVEVHPPFERKQAMKLVRGIMLSDGPAQALEVIEITPAVYEVTLAEGRKRQLRRMVTSLGSHVISLSRVEQAGLKLGKLRPGKWRELTHAEMKSLRAKTSQDSEQNTDED
ncbi:MAG: rRNA pseudouridine synthase [Calditrichaeota bacterium]|nr:rRNA pseudouridine synthase [Calditrichota bacterium]MCB9368321.1 rRNA pseudouridine synthase [Calditrichota bacterium]